MKTPYTLLSLVAAILIGGCGRLNSPVLPFGEEQPGAGQYTARLAELDKADASAQKFFEERGAGACWKKLQQLHNSSTQRGLVFQLGLLQQGGVADEVMAGVIRYLARYHPRQVKSLKINGSDDNYLTALDPAIGDLTNLTTLELYNNQLTEIPTAIGQLINLTTLSLSNNQLTALPQEIGKLANLTELYLSNNQLQALPQEIGGLTNLTTLYLDKNKLTEVPTAIGDLTNLKSLYLFNNQLTALPTAIGQLTNLTELDLDNNQLTCFSEKLLLWYQQVGNRIATDGNPWWQPAELSMISREKLEKIAATPLDAFHDTMRGMAEDAMKTEKFRVNLVEGEDKVKVTLQNRDFHRLTVFTLLPHLLRQGQLNRDRSIVFFERAIPFYVDRQLCSQQDVNNMLQDLEGRQLYRRLPEALSEQQ